MIEKIQARFNHLINFIEQANTDTIDGKTADLSDLDKHVNSVCNEVQEAGPDVAKEVQPLMATLISKLDELEQSLRIARNQKTGSKKS